MSGHAPGPWRWLNDSTLIADHGHRHIVLVAGHHRGSLEQRGEDGLLHPFDCGSPDAHLIAAAPDLLAALKGLLAQTLPYVDGGHCSCPFCTAVNAAEAAIKKAGG